MSEVSKEDFQTAISDIKNQLEKLSERIDKISLGEETAASRQQVQDGGLGPEEGRLTDPVEEAFGPQGTQTGPRSGASGDRSDQDYNFQKDFESVKDKYSKHHLPQHLKVHDPAGGIKQDCKPALKILSKSARYTETALKILTDICPNQLSYGNPEINDLFSVLAAQINFLQSEYSGLVVRSTFDEETSRLFKSLESNSSAFSERSLGNVRVAAELAAISARNGRGSSRPPNRGRGSRGYYNQGASNHNLYGGRGFYNNFNSRGRGGYFDRSASHENQL